MIDVSRLQIGWRGYPVTMVSPGVWSLLLRAGGHDAVTRRLIRALLAVAKDTAEWDEPSGWIFESWLPSGPGETETIWIERVDGVRDVSEDKHEGGRWSIYLPGER
jgi:hypothetical protein